MASHLLIAWLLGGAGANTNPVYKSTDGLTWTLLRGDDGSASGINRFWMSDDGTRMIEKTGSGAYYFSTDSGATWTSFVNTPAASDAMCILPSGRLVVAGGANGSKTIYTSDNGGAAWSAGTLLPGQSAAATVVMSGSGGFFRRAANGALFICGYDQNAQRPEFVWKSTDNGTTWTQVANIDPGFRTAAPTLVYKKTAIREVLLMAFGGVGSSGGIQIWRSIDLGATWTNVLTDTVNVAGFGQPELQGYQNNPGWMSNGDWLCCAFYVADAFGDTTERVWASVFPSDGAAWTLAAGRAIPYVQGAAPNTPEFFAWGDTNKVTWASSEGSSVPNNTYRSTDGGLSWVHFTSAPFDVATYAIQFMVSLAADPLPGGGGGMFPRRDTKANPAAVGPLPAGSIGRRHWQ